MKVIYVVCEHYERPNKAYSTLNKLKAYLELSTKNNVCRFHNNYSIDDIIESFKKETPDLDYGHDKRIFYHSKNGAEISILISQVVMR